jgi:predicted nuclease of predicted toxin-antitoxin system
MIRILLDQNIHSKIETWLQSTVGEKADVTSTRTLGMQRMSDDEIFLFCQNRNMVIVTFDEDYQNPLVIENIPGYGVVRLNIYPTGFAQTQEALKRLIESYPVETWEYASIVVDSRKIRFRKKRNY